MKIRKSNISRRKGLTLLEMVISLAIVSVMFATTMPIFTNAKNSWEARQASSEAIQNGRVLVDCINRHLTQAVKITAVSNSSDSDGYIEFVDNTATTLRCDIAANNYIQFGPVGSQSELAGPVTSLKFTCYGLDDLDTPITDTDSIRFVKVDTTLNNSGGLGQDKNFRTAAYLHINSISGSPSTKMYWTDDQARKIKCANLDGSSVEDVLTGLSAKTPGVALDVAAGKIYWTDGEQKKIKRANLDGSSVEDVLTGLSGKIGGITLDVAAGKMYWTDDQTRKIKCANLDGSSVKDVLTALSKKTPGVALDVAAGKIYWTDGEQQKIKRANLDGSSVEDVLIGLSETIGGIALDVAAGKMYWTDSVLKKIQRANLDGSSVEDVLTGLGEPKGIALDGSGGGQVLP